MTDEKISFPEHRRFRYPEQNAYDLSRPRREQPRLDVVDAQVHLAAPPEQAIAAMDALDIRGVLIDETWGYSPDGIPLPGFRLPNGVFRSTPALGPLCGMQYPDRFSYLVKLLPDDPDVDSIIRLAAAAPHARALRTWVHGDRELAALATGGYGPLFRAAANYGLPVFIHLWSEEQSVHLLAPYARDITELRLIVDHCGTPHTAGQYEAALRLADHPNVFMKWGHAPHYFSLWAADRDSVLTFPFPGLGPYLRQAIDAFGHERILWASDHTAIQTGHSWAETLFYVRESPTLSAEEKEWILGRTLRTLLNWPEQS